MRAEDGPQGGAIANEAAKPAPVRRIGPVAQIDMKSWRSLRAPEVSLAWLIELPLAFAVGMAVFVVWVLRTPLAPVPLSLEALLAVFVGVTVLHEAIHLAALPRGSTGASGLFRPFVPSRWRRSNLRSLSRARYVAALLLPLLLLSLLPALIAPLMPASGMALVAPSIVNALLSSGDLLVVILVLAQVPARARVRLQGNDILWQPHDVDRQSWAAPISQLPSH